MRIAHRITGSVLMALAVILGVATTAAAYWTSSGVATGSATTATVHPAATVVASNTPGETVVGLAWTAPAGPAPDGYYVTRTEHGGATTPACASSPTALVTSPCTDPSLPPGTYHYTVVAVLGSWTSAGADSNAVTVSVDTTPPAVTVTSVNGVPRTFPFATNATVTSIGGTCGTEPSDSVTVRPLIDGVATTPATATCTAGSWSVTPASPLSADATLTLSATQSDNAGNTGSAPDRTLIIDRTRPVVASIDRAGAAAAVDVGPLSWTVTFSEPVAGVAASDFALITSGITGTPTITGVTAVGGAPSATWTVSTTQGGVTGSDTGSIGLDLVDPGAIADAATNTLSTTSFTGQSYTFDTTRPSAISVDRAGAAAAVNVGPLSWTVTFSEPVTGVVAANFAVVASGITGTPTITGVSAVGGAPAASWTVSVGVTGVTGTTTGSIGLDLVARGAIADRATNTLITTTLPGQTYGYDTTRPTVTGVSSPLANGSYRAGQLVPVTVTFSEPVAVTGTPQLRLATGSPATTAVDMTSGTGTSTLTFAYTVAAGNTSADLDYASAAALVLNGGTITDAAANSATLTLPAPGASGSLGASKALVIDTSAPVVSVTEVDGSVVAFPYYTRRNVTSIGGTCGTAPGDSTVVRPLLDGLATNPATTTCAAGAWTLTFASKFSSTGVLSATQVDAAGNTGTASEQTLSVDRERPTLTSIDRAGPVPTVNSGPLSWTVTFSEPVLGVAATDFGLATSGITGTVSITGISALGGAPSSTWTVTASTAGATGTNTGSIRLDLTGRGAITDPATNTLRTRSFTGQAYTYDTTAPTVTGVSSPIADGSYAAGQVIPVAVTFDDPVTVTGTPRLRLATGSPATTLVDYTSGSGTATLTFQYVVADGNTSTDLDYASTAALVLNGGSITDAATNAATLALPAPGAPGSLGSAKALVIDTTPPAVTVSEIGRFTFWFWDFVWVSGTAQDGDGPVTVHLCNNVGPPCDATNATQTFTSVAVTNGTWTTDWSDQVVPGTWYASASQTDAAGNTGTSSVFGPVTD